MTEPGYYMSRDSRRLIQIHRFLCPVGAAESYYCTVYYTEPYNGYIPVSTRYRGSYTLYGDTLDPMIEEEFIARVLSL